jgi:hypothetical protein
MSTPERSETPVQDPDGPAARAGMSLEEYERRVWDMAKSVVHVPAIYAVAQVVGLTKLIPHAWFQEPGVGGWREAGVFLCGFLGAWAAFYSTLLRDAGLRSWTVTFLVPAAVLAAVLIWAVFPPVEEMSRDQAIWAAAILAGPGPVGWVFTMRRWRIEKARAAEHLEGTRPW